MSRPVFGQEVATIPAIEQAALTERDYAAIEALDQTDGWEVRLIKNDTRTKLTLWYDNDDPGRARVASLLRMLGRRDG